jgi:hypothetical protein
MDDLVLLGIMVTLHPSTVELTGSRSIYCFFFVLPDHGGVLWRANSNPSFYCHVEKGLL